MQTPILWSHGMVDRTVLFEAGQAGPPFLEQAGVSCEFKVYALLHLAQIPLPIHQVQLGINWLVVYFQAYPGLVHSISNEELRYLESWIKTRLQSSS